MFWVHKWWHNSTTTSAMRDQFRSLVHAGQIEFLNGGWVMQDDTVSHWEADIAQVTATHAAPCCLWFRSTSDLPTEPAPQVSLGHGFIAETFGREYIPRIGWHIDPFGA